MYIEYVMLDYFVGQPGEVMRTVFLLATTLFFLSGCATVFDPKMQTIRVIATCHGQSVPANCILENKKGFWEVNAPGSVNVEKDASGLHVQCHSPYFKGGSARLNAAPNNFLLANALLGGVVGVGLDVFNGKGFSYSQTIKVNYAECR